MQQPEDVDISGRKLAEAVLIATTAMAVRGETAAGASLRRSSINSVSLSDRDAEEQAPAGGYGGPTTPLLAKLSVPATPPAAAPAKRVMLTQLAGLRFLATTWILCGHYAQGERPGAPRGLFALLNRGCEDPALAFSLQYYSRGLGSRSHAVRRGAMS